MKNSSKWQEQLDLLSHVPSCAEAAQDNLAGHGGKVEGYGDNDGFFSEKVEGYHQP